MGSSPRAFTAGIAALICLVVIPVVFLSALMGAAAQTSCAAPVAPLEGGEASDPSDLPPLEIARRIYERGLQMEMDERQILTAFATVIVEAGGNVTMGNPPGGMGTSVGAFQQQDHLPWNRRNRMNIAAAATTFFEVLRQRDHGQSIGELAQDVQGSAYPEKYTLVVDRARWFLERVKGFPGNGGGEGLGSITAPGTNCAGGPVGPPGRGKIGRENDVIPPANAPPRVRRVIEAANRINHLPYVWGGGHGSFVDPRGYDCSGSVGYALHAGGFQDRTMVSGEYGSWGRPGPGRWITVYSNAGHVWMVVAGVRFDTSSYEAVSSGDGPRWRTGPRPTAGFIQTHPGGF